MTKTSSLTVKCFVVFLLLAFSVPASAASLWSDSAPTANLYGDRKAHLVGDILTILIRESSSAVRTGQSNNSKSANAKADAGVGIFNWITEANAGTSDSFKSQGSIANTNSIQAKITVQVTEVKPNGNLIFTGTQSIKQNNEEQKITIMGEVRPDDIAPDNSVLSTYVANAQIKIEGKGPISRKQRQGILTQIFNFLF